MKKALLILSFILPAFFAFSALPLESKTTKAAALQVKIGMLGEKVSLAAFTEMSINEYEALSGERLSWFGKMHFRYEQRKLRKLLNSDDNSPEQERVYKELDQSKGFNLAGFMMGFTLSLLGVLTMYLSKDSRKANRTKWAWIGAAFWVAFLIIVIAVA